MHTSNTPAQVPADNPVEIIWGAMRIGQFINCNTRKAFYLLEKGMIPGRKIGDTWVSTKAELRAAVLGIAA